MAYKGYPMNRENFAELLQESLDQSDLRPGAVVKAIVIKVLPDFVMVNAGLKSEASIPSKNLKMTGVKSKLSMKATSLMSPSKL